MLNSRDLLKKYATAQQSSTAAAQQQHNSAFSAMQLATVARHSRRCARGTIERRSRRWSLSSTSTAASGDEATWVVAPLPGSNSLAEPQSLPTKLEPPDESCSCNCNGSGSSRNDNRSSGSNSSSSRSTPPADFSASSVDTGEVQQYAR